MNRKLNLIYTPPAQPGFLGAGHVARPVLQGSFKQTDPFILLMDDMLDKQDATPVGGPHPHAGFETVSLLLEGEIGAGEHKMQAGDFQIMTAGSGVVHSETIEKKAKMRLLQMWLNLPANQRWAAPRLQDLAAEKAPVSNENGTNIRVYSGTFAGVSSPILNYVPLIIADIKMLPSANAQHSIPASFKTFLYVIEGSVKVGDEQKILAHDQVGWLNTDSGNPDGYISLFAGESGARIILYAAEPQQEEIVSHGPFIGDTNEDIQRLYKEFRQGKMNDVHTLPKERLIIW
jgi:redox-sensitive bicupin YhaK (pirin superfamily)